MNMKCVEVGGVQRCREWRLTSQRKLARARWVVVLRSSLCTMS